ncbi:hypothetical protein PR048_030050 [Dryococelus australis]|uniref:Reverse transcriptase n=1 Tax=Dryococelus australis TaxID=614101 RepID=A0ABQ9G7V7_9NEOP|nr:hypothetical protein PR048_030050 [Dryococelus australis]
MYMRDHRARECAEVKYIGGCFDVGAPVRNTGYADGPGGLVWLQHAVEDPLLIWLPRVAAGQSTDLSSRPRSRCCTTLHIPYHILYDRLTSAGLTVCAKSTQKGAVYTFPPITQYHTALRMIEQGGLQFLYNYQRQPLNMFQVDFPQGTEYKIRAVSSVLGLAVRIETYKHSRAPLQCSRCCRLRHVTAQCRFTVVCPHCSGPHNKEVNCTRAQKCINCEQQHNAKYLSCPVYAREAAPQYDRERQPHVEYRSSNPYEALQQDSYEDDFPPPRQQQHLRRNQQQQDQPMQLGEQQATDPPRQEHREVSRPEAEPPVLAPTAPVIQTTTTQPQLEVLRVKQTLPLPIPPLEITPARVEQLQNDSSTVYAQIQKEVATLYTPPGKTITHENLVTLTNSDPTFLALGDLNAKHPSLNCVGKTQNGQLRYSHQQIDPYFVCTPETPAKYPEDANYRPVILDITIYKNINFTYELEVLQEQHSNHLPVLATLDNANTEATQATQVRNFKKANWPRPDKYITRNINCGKQLINTGQVQEYTEHLTNVIQNTIDASIPLTAIKKCQVEFPARIKYLIQARNRARRTWQRNRQLDYILREVNQLQREIRKQLSLHRAMEWEAKVAKLTAEDNTLWKSHTLEKAFQPYETPQCPQHTAHIEQQMVILLARQPTTRPDPTSPEEIKQTIRKMKSCKASGADGITTTLLKQLAESPLTAIVSCINGILGTDTLPKTWKPAKVILFRKLGKDPTLPQNYRPISLLNKRMFHKAVDQAPYSNILISKLCPLLDHKGSLTHINGKILYKVCIRPIITYAAPAWGYATKTHLRKLQLLQNKVLRRILQIPAYVRLRLLHKEANIETLQDFMRKQATSFYKSTINHTNPLISQVGAYEATNFRTHKRLKHILCWLSLWFVSGHCHQRTVASGQALFPGREMYHLYLCSLTEPCCRFPLIRWRLDCLQGLFPSPEVVERLAEVQLSPEALINSLALQKGRYFARISPGLPRMQMCLGEME